MFLIALLLLYISGQVVCTGTLYGSYMQYHTFRKEEIYSLYACKAECQMSSVCQSISYHRTNHICHLNDNNIDEDSIISRTDYIFSDKDTWTQSLDGPCSSITCALDKKCLVDRLHRARCEPEFTGCGEPPDVAGTQKDYDGHYLHALTTYTCTGGYLNCGDTTSECQSTGHWDNVEVKCELSVWNNPPVDAKFYHPCGPANKLNVVLVSTMTQMTRWRVKMFQGDAVPLSLAFRYNHGDDGNVTTINSNDGVQWQGSVTIPIIPVVVGEEFRMGISFEHGVFRVEVDGEYFTELTERTVGITVEYLQLGYDVSIARVEFI